MLKEHTAKPKLYVETTVPSYLAARDSRDSQIRTHQVMTRKWWDGAFRNFDLFVSDVVLQELGRGDPKAAEKRLQIVSGIPPLEVTHECKALAAIYIRRLGLPHAAEPDALHMAVATVNTMDYLLTWNCRHMANRAIMAILPRINVAHGLNTPVICTPEDLFYAEEKR